MGGKKKDRKVVTVTTPDEPPATLRQGQAVVTLGGEELTLTVPRSYAVRVDIVGFVAVNVSRAYAAALGVCLPHLRKPRTSYEACRYDVGLFGGAVLDELTERGIDIEELVAASSAAYDLVRAGLVRASELKEAEGN